MSAEFALTILAKQQEIFRNNLIFIMARFLRFDARRRDQIISKISFLTVVCNQASNLDSNTLCISYLDELTKYVPMSARAIQYRSYNMEENHKDYDEIVAFINKLLSV